MAISFRGHKPTQNREAIELLGEYISRKKLSDIGYTFDSANLSERKAQAFLLISSEIDHLKAEEQKKQNAKAKRRKK